MHNSRLTILAINPGTRYIGIAVLNGPVLLDWSVRVVNGRLSEEKLAKTVRMISRLIAEYQPDVLALKRLHPSRRSAELNRLTEEIAQLVMANGIKLHEHSIQEVKMFHSQEDRINKTGLAELMCQKHPVLRHELNRERNNINPYHIRMFEAVALAAMVAAHKNGRSSSSICHGGSCMLAAEKEKAGQ